VRLPREQATFADERTKSRTAGDVVRYILSGMAGFASYGADDPPVRRIPQAGILVVEDDADHRETLRDILEEEGYRVTTAVHGRDALARLDAGPLPDLILLDLMMPEMDGWTLMEKLSGREGFASLPIIVTSQVGNRVPQSASTRYISKPLDRTRLLQTISSCLWRRSRANVPSRFIRVLVVDDSMIGTTIARLLAWDHDVVTVPSGRVALARIAAGDRYDAILCDLHLPDMTGLELRAALPPDQAARLVLTTGGAVDPEIAAALRRMGSRWIDKPFTMEELRSLIQMLVGEEGERPGATA
jgi:CheY-like chemotaxis protein